MTQGGFKRALPLVLVHEGGFSNHPSDPGGATMKGVTQRVYDAYRKGRSQPPRSVRQISDVELSAIYRRQYWDAIHGDGLPAGLDYAVFDFAVNSGGAQAVKELQRIVGTGVDGRIGLRTIEAVCDAAMEDPGALIDAYCDRRLAFMRRLKTWATFGKGWTRRVDGVRVQAQDMALGGDGAATVDADPDPVSAAAADPGQTAVLKTEPGKGALVATGGVAMTGVGGIAKLADLGDQVSDGADRVGTTASSVQAAGQAVHGFLGLDFQVLLMIGVVLAAGGLVYLLAQLAHAHKETTR